MERGLPYEILTPAISVRIDGLISIHYFEYTADFTWGGESHDFWELIYCDKGSLQITAENREITLKCGHFYIHPPNEFHNIRPGDGRTANSVVLSFSGKIPELFPIADMDRTADDYTRTILFTILRESRYCFGNRLGQVNDPKLVRSEKNLVFGSEQVILREMELLLIHLIRGGKKPDCVSPAFPGGRNDLLSHIMSYLETNTHNKLSIKLVSQQFSISPTALKKLFSSSLGTGVMSYFLDCKIREAKRMIAEKEKNCSQIAQILGFSSVHYFSRIFKLKTGMSPTEYERSVKSLLEQAGASTQ